jgi:truncated hemoglobin YjbI
MSDLALSDEIEANASKGKKLFDRLGGRPTLETVHKSFYDKIYAHPWLGQLFAHVSQPLIEAQQSDFMSYLMGGPKIYSGRMPIDAHIHILITEEMFSVRHELLRESLADTHVSEQECKEWLAIDLAFKKVLIKKSREECEARFKGDTIMDIPNPDRLRKIS